MFFFSLSSVLDGNMNYKPDIAGNKMLRDGRTGNPTSHCREYILKQVERAVVRPIFYFKKMMPLFSRFLEGISAQVKEGLSSFLTYLWLLST